MDRNYLKWFYLAIGISGFILFLWTGRLMRYGYPDKETLDMGFRVMLRSRHIFLLLFSLIEIGIGAYIRQATDKIDFGIQLLATFLIVCAHGLFLAGFFNEVGVDSIPKTPMIHWATYLGVAGILMHLVTTIKRED